MCSALLPIEKHVEFVLLALKSRSDFVFLLENI